MIAKLTGKIEISGDTVIIDVNGVGYLVSVASGTLVISNLNDATLHIHTIVKEDSLKLYGFVTRFERQVFAKLISVRGLGPATALTLFGQLGVNTIITALKLEDVSKFTSVPGIGPKTAQNIVTSLRGTF